MSDNWKDALTDKLCDALLSLGSREEAYDFLEDVGTISELRAWSQRLEVARLLNKSMTYPQIAQETGASTATISRVKRCLDYGPGGYRLILGRVADSDADTSKGDEDASVATKRKGRSRP